MTDVIADETGDGLFVSYSSSVFFFCGFHQPPGTLFPSYRLLWYPPIFEKCVICHIG